MSKPSDHAFNFEAVLLGATKDKNGFVVKLAIHPNDVPDNFIKDMVGSRYEVAAVLLGDDGQPKKKAKPQAAEEIKHAALLCKNPNFWKFTGSENEQETIDRVRRRCGVDSRSELGSDEKARRRFHEMVAEYETWLKAQDD